MDVLIRIVPYRKVAQVFDHAFHKMGDSKPDFYTETHHFLTVCSKLLTKKSKTIKVDYQSYMSLMKYAWSNMLLSELYLLIRLVDGKNDGMISGDSAKWGHGSL